MISVQRFVEPEAEVNWQLAVYRVSSICTFGKEVRSRRMPTPYCYLRCGDLRSPGVTERRIGPLGLRDDDDHDDDDVRSRRAQLAPGFTRKQ